MKTNSDLAERLRSARLARGWAQKDLARHIADVAAEMGVPMPQRESLIRAVKSWESGAHRPRAPYPMLIARALGADEGKLFGDGRPRDDGDSDAVELMTLAGRAETSQLGAGTLDDLDAVVDQLCREYPRTAPAVLQRRAKTHLKYVMDLLDSRTTLAQHKELLVHAGWLAALLGCVYFDLGDRLAADMARRLTLRLGEQAGHGEIIAWSWELAAWFALVDGRFSDVVTYAEGGQRYARNSSAGAQLTLQAGRGYARMGDARATEALKIGKAALNQLPQPTSPDHHFVFDPAKYEFYAGTIFTQLGHDDAAAEEHVREVIEQCKRPGGGIRWPMRLAITSLDLAVIATRRGDLEEAVSQAGTALMLERRSAQLLPRAVELHAALREQYPRERLVTDYGSALHEEYGVTLGHRPLT
ncbi:hypothetical protein Misp01_60720 [Microtetraspora sp. NBRC 13810]|uniref:hypothetical protein n=1 Tax=Microtetraspora sp. NBRC 13810 TaxID=3030990 RepID=UPI0024A0473D|nr:hypothetical protein [Microtetraspora sp. NBRC 13810]GLW10944.1 hypothetical protein Misp01_60720 [Microtetraspora sp. NBRC 13810]